MVRHNYINCITCHVSPSGGGVLTQYGRELSKEVLSATGKEGEQQFVYGAVNPPEWLKLGGDIRALAFYKDSPTVTEGRMFPMQLDLEAAATHKTVTLAATLGYKGEKFPTQEPISKKIISRRHYLNYRPTDEWSLRVGRFEAAYGINTPDHAIFIKRGLGWDQGTESYNLEAAYLGEKISVFGSAITGRPDDKSLDREKGMAWTVARGISDSYKVGFSYFYGTNSQARRHVAGPWGILGFSPHFFLLSEFDFQSITPSAATSSMQRGMVDYQRLDYEFFQGFHGYLTQELSRLDFGNPSSSAKIYGIGVQFFPRPHFEFNLAWQIKTAASAPGYTDFAYLLFHFYL